MTKLCNLFPRVIYLPTPKGAREEKPRPLRLVTWFGEKFIFMAGGPIFQNIVAASICHIQNRHCFSPANLGKLSWDFTAKPYHIYQQVDNLSDSDSDSEEGVDSAIETAMSMIRPRPG